MKIGCVPSGAVAGFYTLSGELVMKVTETGGMIEWDGLNTRGREASSGIYFYLVQTGGQTVQKGKFLLVR